MVQNSALFASARVNARENKLIGNERFLRMAEADTADDALKILYEVSFADGMVLNSAAEYQKLIDADLESLLVFFESVCTDSNVLRCFTLRYDYHNAKALAKAKFLRLFETGFMTYENCGIPVDFLKECINSDNYTFLPKAMAKALGKIDMDYASTGKNPRYIDITLDKAMYEDRALTLAEIRDNAVKEYFISETDVTNIITALKCRQLHMAAKEYEEQFMQGGSVKLKDCIMLSDSNAETSDIFKHTNYKDIIKTAEGSSIAEAEIAADNYLNAIFKNKRFDVSSIYPLLNYYLIKQAELKNVKLVFTGIMGGADKSEIKKRLRAV